MGKKQFSAKCQEVDITGGYMDMDFDGLRADIVQMLGGGHIRVNTHSFQNDMLTFKIKDDILTLPIHLGYLAYDSVEKEAERMYCTTK